MSDFMNICRFFLMIWTIYCFNINLIYQSQLIVMLTTPSTEKQITTPDELIGSNVPFGFSRSFEVKEKKKNVNRYAKQWNF